jgi:hypothetical protein
MYYVENGVDAIFVIDIILIFFTTYMDTRLGDEIYNPRQIAMNYMADTFIWDVLPVVPVITGFILPNDNSV